MSQHQHRSTVVRCQHPIRECAQAVGIINGGGEHFFCRRWQGGQLRAVVISGIHRAERYIAHDTPQGFCPRLSGCAQHRVTARSGGFRVAQQNERRGGIVDKTGKRHRVGNAQKNGINAGNNDRIRFYDGFYHDFRLPYTGREGGVDGEQGAKQEGEGGEFFHKIWCIPSREFVLDHGQEYETTLKIE